MINKKRIAQTLDILGQLMPFKEACESEVGVELLSDLRQRYESLLFKIAKVEAIERDKIEYEVVRDLMAKWTTRLALYAKKSKEIDFALKVKNS
jgi:hypothetical protein